MRSHAIAILLVTAVYPLVSARWDRDSTCPTEIKTTIPNGGSRYGSMTSVHETLLHCPDITSLDLKVSLRGCSSWPDRWNFPFAHNGNDAYPRLKTLILDGYDFASAEDTRPPWQIPFHEVNEYELWTTGLLNWLKQGYWMPWLQAQIYGYPPLASPKPNIDLWLGAMDWSTIEELAIDGCKSPKIVAEKLPTLLSSLRKLKSTNRPFIEALPNNTLESLTWIGPHRVGSIQKILERHGRTLQELEFRCDEMECFSMSNKFNMSVFTHMASNLTRLSINIPRNGSWPLESLRFIALLPKLRSLEIYSNLQSECQRQKPSIGSRAAMQHMTEYGASHCTGEDRFQKPLLSEHSAEEIFRFLKQVNNGGQLRNVTFRLGDWTPPWDGPLYQPPWLEHRKVEISCTEQVGTGEGNSCEMIQSLGYWPPDKHSKDMMSMLFDDDE